MQLMVARDTPALVIDNVTKKYAKLHASSEVKHFLKRMLKPERSTVVVLDSISFEVAQGEFVAYAGANGAGKSTTMKILSGILQPNLGSVQVLGMSPAKNRVELMRHIGVLFGQRTELWWDQPVITSFSWKKEVWNIPEKVYNRNLEMVCELLDLQPILNTFSRELSLGQRMRADLGMLLLHSPKVIFLDEPTLGLDVLAKRQMIGFLKELNEKEDTTIVVTSHDMDDLEEMAKRIILISEGKIIFDGDFQTLRDVRGGISEVHIKRKGAPPEIAGLILSETHDDMHTYTMDNGGTTLDDILRELANLGGIKDLEINKTSLEELIATLYTELKTNKAIQ